MKKLPFPYPTSRDYDELIRLMQTGHEVVCLCDYQGCRDIARSRYEPPTVESDQKAYFAVQSRGICYAGGMRLYVDEFKKDCYAVHLEFVPPAALSTPPPPVVPLAEAQSLADALQSLRDEQNGPPLERHKIHWQEAYDKATRLLSEWDAKHPQLQTA